MFQKRVAVGFPARSIHEQVSSTTHALGGPRGRPALSVVVLTWNEEHNIGACLDALGRQEDLDFEVLVLDAASTDRTVDVVRGRIPESPVPVRLDVADSRLAIGPARNRGVRLARADVVAFMSADAEPDPDWTTRARENIRSADLVFGRQVHAPAVRTVPGLVRGLRYHFPDGPTDDPSRYASHVSAVLRREVLAAFPFGSSLGASAVDDVLLARRAAKAGYRVAYDPRMVVRHRDVESWRAEWAKNAREGRGLGEYARELGLQVDTLAWGLLLAGSLVLLAAFPSLPMLGIAVVTLWVPALRRAWRRRHKMRPRDLALGTLFSPPFDVTFLASYVVGLLRRKAMDADLMRGGNVNS